jgi:3-hydroxyanthranilate 3,4-dioxygenase
MSRAIDFQRWIDEHRDLLKPPVGNKVVYPGGDFIVMVVGGPNARKDYHFNEGPEFFHQIEGEMVLRTMTADGPVDVPIRAGEIHLLPPRVPHSPQRMPDSVGLVIEQKRRPGELDGLMWFCESCNHKLYEEFFELRSIETDFPPVFDRFFGAVDHRTCERCGTVMEPPGS